MRRPRSIRISAVGFVEPDDRSLTRRECLAGLLQGGAAGWVVGQREDRRCEGWRVVGVNHGANLAALWPQVARGSQGFTYRAALAESVTLSATGGGLPPGARSASE